MANEHFNNYINDQLKSRYWIFTREDGVVMSNALRFISNGVISGYRNPNERYWAYSNGRLDLLNHNKSISAIFNDFSINGESIRIKGRHTLNGANGPAFYLDSQDENYTPDIFSPAREFLPGRRIGAHTYGSIEVIDSNGIKDVEIGKFTSIGPNVRLICGNHNYHFVSNYPFKSISNDFWDKPDGIDDHIYNDKTLIGNDVWIGHSVIIKGGITIGNGAVIAAGSVVTKDVPPYAIIGGSPAKVIKHRFSERQIKALEKICWFDWDDDKINENLPLIMSDDIDKFILSCDA